MNKIFLSLILLSAAGLLEASSSASSSSVAKATVSKPQVPDQGLPDIGQAQPNPTESQTVSKELAAQQKSKEDKVEQAQVAAVKGKKVFLYGSEARKLSFTRLVSGRSDLGDPKGIGVTVEGYLTPWHPQYREKVRDFCTYRLTGVPLNTTIEQIKAETGIFDLSIASDVDLELTDLNHSEIEKRISEFTPKKIRYVMLAYKTSKLKPDTTCSQLCLESLPGSISIPYRVDVVQGSAEHTRIKQMPTSMTLKDYKNTLLSIIMKNFLPKK